MHHPLKSLAMSQFAPKVIHFDRKITFSPRLPHAKFQGERALAALAGTVTGKTGQWINLADGPGVNSR
jgi:hypothetical protein